MSRFAVASMSYKSQPISSLACSSQHSGERSGPGWADLGVCLDAGFLPLYVRSSMKKPKPSSKLSATKRAKSTRRWFVAGLIGAVLTPRDKS